MSNPWFRLYSEFAHDPKVQMMTEAMQRRYIMLMCMRCSNVTATLRNDEIAFQLRISESELKETKVFFIEKGFIDDSWNLVNWDKRQFKSDYDVSGAERQKRYRENKRNALRNVSLTLPDTDTDTEQREPKGSLSPAKLPTCPTQPIIDLYHAELPELPSIKILSDLRKKAIGTFWKWVLTSKRTDGENRANGADEALTWIGSYFRRAKENDFLMGRNPQSGVHGSWQCDLDFLMTEKGKKHVIEKTRGAQ
jgi:hypothetical protein